MTANPTDSLASQVVLREVIESDLPFFFAQQQDPVANHMAAFTAEDPADHAKFLAHWAKIRANAANLNRTILWQGQVVGNIASFIQFGEREVSYWLGREVWGKGVATQALLQFLPLVEERPLFGRAAKDNLGSIRVLQKCGFTIVGEDKGFANARGAEIEEFILRLDTP